MKKGSKKNLLSIISATYAKRIRRFNGLISCQSVCDWETSIEGSYNRDMSGACHYYAKTRYRTAVTKEFNTEDVMVTSLGTYYDLLTSKDGCSYKHNAIRWFKFITDKRISPWRYYLKEANPVVYYMSNKHKDLPTHIKLDMSAASKYCDLGYNFLVATRMVVDRPHWILDWVRYMDVKGMSPADALYMVSRYATKGGTGQDNKTYVPTTNSSQHPFNTGHQGVSLSRFRKGSKLTRGSLFNYNNRLWREAEDVTPLSYHGSIRSPIFTYARSVKVVNQEGVQKEIDVINKSRKAMSK